MVSSMYFFKNDTTLLDAIAVFIAVKYFLHGLCIVKLNMSQVAFGCHFSPCKTHLSLNLTIIYTESAFINL